MKPKAVTNLDLDRAIVAAVDAITEEIGGDWAEEFTPRGLCATGCGYPATVIWIHYKGVSRYDFRCEYCDTLGRINRIYKANEKLPALEAKLLELGKTRGEEPNGK